MKQGWEVKRLEEVCGFQNGFAFKSNLYKNNGLPILRITNIQGDLVHTNDLVYFDDKDYREDFNKYKVIPNDLVIAMSGATTGKLGINTTDTTFYLNQRVGKFLPRKELSKGFLYYFLSTKVEENLIISAGAAQPNLSTEQIKNFQIPIPPLPEQHRIVAILDEAFAAIDKAKENAEKNLANAREVFEAYLQSVFSNPGEGWLTWKLKEITSKIGSGATPSGGEKSYKEHGISLIRSLNVHDYGFKYKDLALIDDVQAAKLDNVTVEVGDVLLNITGASIARCCIVPKQVLPARVNQHVSIIRVNKNILLPKFLHYAFISKEHKDRLLSTGEEGGATRQALTKTQLEEYSVSFPSLLAEQDSIITNFEDILAETQKLEAIYQQKLADLDELKKSILEKAFASELSTN